MKRNMTDLGIYRRIVAWFDRRAIMTFCFSLAFGIINFFYFCTHNALAPDAVGIGAQHVANGWEISLGRWGIQFVDFARGGLVNPYLITIACILMIALSNVIVVKMFNVQKISSLVILSGLIMCFPVFSESALFIYCFDSYSLAMLLASFAAYLMIGSVDIFSRKIAIICAMMVFSLALYQAYIGVTTGLLLIYIIIGLVSGKLNKKKAYRLVIRFALTIIASLVVYYLITRVVGKITHHSLSSYKGANSSIASLFGNIFAASLNTFRDFANIFILDSNHIFRDMINVTLLAMTTIFLFVVYVKNNRNKGNSHLGLFVLALLLFVSPVLVGVVSVVTQSRMNLLTAAPMISYYVLMVCVAELCNRAWHTVYVVISLGLIYSFLLSNQATFMAREDTYRNFYYVSGGILDKAEELSGNMRNYHLCLSFAIEYESPLSSRSNNFIAKVGEFTSDFRGMTNIAKFYKMYMGKDITFCSADEYKELVDNKIFDSMPVYPKDGSIKIVDDIIVVRNSDKTYSYGDFN